MYSSTISFCYCVCNAALHLTWNQWAAGSKYYVLIFEAWFILSYLLCLLLILCKQFLFDTFYVRHTTVIWIDGMFQINKYMNYGHVRMNWYYHGYLPIFPRNLLPLSGVKAVNSTHTTMLCNYIPLMQHVSA